MKKCIFIILINILIIGSAASQEIEFKNIGGKPLELLKNDFKERFVNYTFDYLRMYKMFSKDNTFADYLNDGNDYTVFVPVEEAMDEYYAANGGRNGNFPRLRNTLKYNIVKGKMLPEEFKDGQKLRTIHGSGSFIEVSVKKGKIKLTDMYGNSLKLTKPIIADKVILYPVDVFLRYK